MISKRHFYVNSVQAFFYAESSEFLGTTISSDGNSDSKYKSE